MKKSLVLSALMFIVSFTSSYAQPSSFLLNDYFGVYLSVDENYAFNMDWNPVRGNMIHENWRTDGDEFAPDPGPRYAVSEAFDIEALYVDVNWQSEMVVFSIVTSMPNTGFVINPWYPDYVFRAGDIRFGLGGDNYVLGTFSGTHAYSRTVDTFGQLYFNPEMVYTDGSRGYASRGMPVLGETDPDQLINAYGESNFYYSEYLDGYGNSLIENGYSTSVLEGMIPFADLGGDLSGGLSMTLGMSCNNDLSTITLSPTPEPATISLLGLGLLGIYARNRFRKK